MAHGESIHYDPDGCLAITGSTGRQCANSDPPLCGTHEKSRSVTRVDEFESGPDEDLRDDLVEECGIPGTRAYKLATLTDSIRELWRICTGLQPVEIAGEEWSGRKLRSYAPNVASHPDLDVDHHPLASDNCVAVIEDGAFGDEYRCTTSGHGRLLCGVHQDNQDLRTIFDEDFEGYDCPIVWVNGEKCRLIERRGDDVIAATVGDWSLERFEDPDLENSEGLPMETNGWKLRATDERRAYDAQARFERVLTYRTEDGNDENVKLIATNSDCRAVVEDGLDWIDAVDTLAEWVQDHEPTDVADLLKESGEPYEEPPRPPALKGIEEGDTLTVRQHDQRWSGEISDIGGGTWQTPIDVEEVSVYLDGVEIFGYEDGMLALECQRDPAGEWSPITATFMDDLPSSRTEDLGQVSVSVGSDIDEDNDGDMGEVDEDGAKMGDDGDRDDVDELTEPEPPESLPKYLVEGVQKQDVAKLESLIDYAEGMIDYQEAVAERELEKQAADEEPDEWDEDEWQERKEEALEKADISATKATLTIKEIDDNRYYYYQWREGGQIKSQYIAPVSPSE